jgi:hypothetical protein
MALGCVGIDFDDILHSSTSRSVTHARYSEKQDFLARNGWG